MGKKNPRSKNDLQAENDELWQTLESLHYSLDGMFNGDNDDPEADADE